MPNQLYLMLFKGNLTFPLFVAGLIQICLLFVLSLKFLTKSKYLGILVSWLLLFPDGFLLFFPPSTLLFVKFSIRMRKIRTKYKNIFFYDFLIAFIKDAILTRQSHKAFI